MSALPPKADIRHSDSHVRFVPKADILRCSKDVVIRSPRRRGLKRGWHGNSKCLGGFQVDDHFEGCRLVYWEVCRFLPFEDS